VDVRQALTGNLNAVGLYTKTQAGWSSKRLTKILINKQIKSVLDFNKPAAFIVGSETRFRQVQERRFGSLMVEEALYVRVEVQSPKVGISMLNLCRALNSNVSLLAIYE
jgi:hypothetical protein